MVRRSSDEPRTLAERSRAQRQQTAELARAQGRGSTALRDSAGNVLVMNPAAPYPLLTPQGIDAAVAFTADGTVKMTSPDTQQDRDMTVRDIGSSGEVKANKITSTGAITSNGPATFSGTLNTQQINTGLFPIFTGGITCTGLTAGTGNIGTQGVLQSGANFMSATQLTMNAWPIFCGEMHCTAVITPASSRSLKKNVRDFEPELGVAAVDMVRAAPVRLWEYDETRTDGLPEGRRMGPMVEDLPEVAVADSGTDHGAAPDLIGMVNIAWEAVRELAQARDSLAETVATLTERVAELEAARTDRE